LRSRRRGLASSRRERVDRGGKKKERVWEAVGEVSSGCEEASVAINAVLVALGET